MSSSSAGGQLSQPSDVNSSNSTFVAAGAAAIGHDAGAADAAASAIARIPANRHRSIDQLYTASPHVKMNGTA